MQQNIPDISKTYAGECAKCGCDTFEVNTIIRMFPAILVGEKTDQPLPIQLLSCKKCGEYFYPLIDPMLASVLKKEQKNAPTNKPHIFSKNSLG